MKHLVYIAILVLFFSCESKTKFKEPEDLIDKELMIDLLTDLHLGVGTNNVQNKNSERDKNYMVLVFNKYKIDSTQFSASNTYYMSKIEEYEEMFEEVERRFIIIRDKYGTIKDTFGEASLKARNRKIKASKINREEIVR